MRRTRPFWTKTNPAPGMRSFAISAFMKESTKALSAARSMTGGRALRGGAALAGDARGGAASARPTTTHAATSGRAARALTGISQSTLHGEVLDAEFLLDSLLQIEALLGIVEPREDAHVGSIGQDGAQRVVQPAAAPRVTRVLANVELLDHRTGDPSVPPRGQGSGHDRELVAPGAERCSVEEFRQ